MKRELKFRAWDNKNKQMGFVEAIEFSVESVGVSPLDFSKEAQERRLEAPTELRFSFTATCRGQKGEFVITESKYLQQYTGLHDKNGKEIFEGDIIKHYWADKYKGTSLDQREVIEKVSGGFINRPVSDKEKRTSYSLVNADNENFEVIGNIYETPELLK